MRLKMLGVLLAVLALAPVLAACGGDDDGGSGDLDDVTIGLTFVPNIQFAPFYVAIEEGYYEDAGLSVTLNHHAAGADQFGALVAGQEDMLMSAGDETMQARAQGVEIVYVAEVFRKYPVALIAPADSDIASVADLAGKKVGIPGEYGANYIGLLALLADAGMTKDDIQIESVGFTQAQALLAGQVDAIMGYLNNEPIQLQKAGMETRTFPVSDALPIVSNGLVAMADYLDENPDQARAIIEATLRGVEFAIENPEEAVEIAKEFVPTLDDEQQAADALAVLQASIPLWRADGVALGSSDPDAWQQTADFLQANGLLANPVAVGDVYSADYLPEE
ncbi:MAG: ABC transporter substrate-binding protein [Thermomicrobiales bacterium]